MIGPAGTFQAPRAQQQNFSVVAYKNQLEAKKLLSPEWEVADPGQPNRLVQTFISVGPAQHLYENLKTTGLFVCRNWLPD